MLKSILSTTLILLVGFSKQTEILSIEPRNVPVFKINFDLPASERYDEVYYHFKDTIVEMENYFYYSIPPKIRDFYNQGNNLELFKLAQPDVFAAM